MQTRSRPRLFAPVERDPFRRDARWRRLLRHVLLVLGALIMLYPLIWMAVSSFKPSAQILLDPSLTLPDPTSENYVIGWDALGISFNVFFLNSLIVALACVAGNIISCALAAYAFARLKFKGRGIYFALMLATIMLPYHAVIIPQYIMFSALDMVNTFGPLIIPKFLASDAFFIFLMVQFIRTLPIELDQAAAVDGAGAFRTFWNITLPLMKPVLATSAIFTFIWSWNDFLGPLIYLTRTRMYTAPVALNALLDSDAQTGWGEMFAMSLLSLIPIVIFFLFVQKYLVRGIATTGIK